MYIICQLSFDTSHDVERKLSLVGDLGYFLLNTNVARAYFSPFTPSPGPSSVSFIPDSCTVKSARGMYMYLYILISLYAMILVLLILVWSFVCN